MRKVSTPGDDVDFSDMERPECNTNDDCQRKCVQIEETPGYTVNCSQVQCGYENECIDPEHDMEAPTENASYKVDTSDAEELSELQTAGTDNISTIKTDATASCSPGDPRQDECCVYSHGTWEKRLACSTEDYFEYKDSGDSNKRREYGIPDNARIRIFNRYRMAPNAIVMHGMWYGWVAGQIRSFQCGAKARVILCKKISKGSRSYFNTIGGQCRPGGIKYPCYDYNDDHVNHDCRVMGVGESKTSLEGLYVNFFVRKANGAQHTCEPSRRRSQRRRWR